MPAGAHLCESLYCLGPLCKIKLRLLTTMLYKRFGAAKLLFLLAFALFTAFIVKSISLDILNFLTLAAVPNELIEWLLGIYCFYLILIVFSGDLITGHTLDTGSLSSDYDYLTTLPIPYFSLTLCKVFERLIADYLGIIFILTSILGIACRSEITLSTVSASFLLYAELGILSGCLINLVLLLLKKVLPVSSINNLFSIAGYVLILFSAVPFIVINQAPSLVVRFAMSYYYADPNRLMYTLLKPVKRLGEFLYKPGFNNSYWFVFALCLVLIILSFAALYAAVKTNTPGSAVRGQNKRTFKKGLFSGLIKKDFLLVKSDFNILINAFLLPISVVILNAFVLRGNVKVKITPNIALNLIYGAAVYFCMFGPCNAIGAEGKAFSLIESMGIYAGGLLRAKFLFWYAASVVIFVPASALTMLLLGFSDSIIITSLIKTALFSAACVWVSVRFSAIFARYDRKVLQQSSEFYAKFFILFMALLMAPLKNFSLINLYTALIALVLCRLIDMKAKHRLFYRNDCETLTKAMPKHINFWLLIFSFLGIEVAVKQLVFSISTVLEPGLWPWVIASGLTFVIALFFKPFSPCSGVKKNGSRLGEMLKCTLCGLALGLLFHYCLIPSLDGFNFIATEAKYFAGKLSRTEYGILGVDLFVFAFVLTIACLTAKQTKAEDGRFLRLKRFAYALALPLIMPVQALALSLSFSLAAYIIAPERFISMFMLVLLSLFGVFV